MSQAVLFVVVFVGLFVFRVVAATVIFLVILPKGDRCPNCDAMTLRVQSLAWNRLMPWFRTSWCYECGWEGMLRAGSVPPAIVSPPPRSALPNPRE